MDTFSKMLHKELQIDVGRVVLKKTGDKIVAILPDGRSISSEGGIFADNLGRQLQDIGEAYFHLGTKVKIFTDEQGRKYKVVEIVDEEEQSSRGGGSCTA